MEFIETFLHFFVVCVPPTNGESHPSPGIPSENVTVSAGWHRFRTGCSLTCCLSTSLYLFCLRNVDVSESRCGLFFLKNWKFSHGRRIHGHLPLCVLSFVVWSFRLADWTCYLHCPSLLPSQLIHISHQCNQWARNFFDSISAVSARFPRIMTSGGGQVDPDAPMDFIASVDETDVTNRADDGAVELFNTRLRPLLHLAPMKIAGVTTKLHRGPTLCQLQLQLIQRVIWPVTNANVCLHFQELPRLKAK